MMSIPRRGRPLKFGRPARPVAVTLPDDVLAALRATDADVGRAIVALVQKHGTRAVRTESEARVVDVARTGRRQRLIVVDPSVLSTLPGCRLMRIGPNQAFITLAPGAGLADLEVAVHDRLSEPHVGDRERDALQTLQQALRRWRKDKRVSVHARSIVVLEGGEP